MPNNLNKLTGIIDGKHQPLCLADVWGAHNRAPNGLEPVLKNVTFNKDKYDVPPEGLITVDICDLASTDEVTFFWSFTPTSVSGDLGQTLWICGDNTYLPEYGGWKSTFTLTSNSYNRLYNGTGPFAKVSTGSIEDVLNKNEKNILIYRKTNDYKTDTALVNREWYALPEWTDSVSHLPITHFRYGNTKPDRLALPGQLHSMGVLRGLLSDSECLALYKKLKGNY